MESGSRSGGFNGKTRGKRVGSYPLHPSDHPRFPPTWPSYCYPRLQQGVLHLSDGPCYQFPSLRSYGDHSVCHIVPLIFKTNPTRWTSNIAVVRSYHSLASQPASLQTNKTHDAPRPEIEASLRIQKERLRRITLQRGAHSPTYRHRILQAS